MESQINVRQSMLEKMKRPFKNNRRLNRYWNSVQLNLTRNSGYYALVSSLMCLCLIGLRSNTEFHDHDEIDSELHYSFHSWEPKVCRFVERVRWPRRSMCTGPFVLTFFPYFLLQKPMEIRPRERVSMQLRNDPILSIVKKTLLLVFWFRVESHGLTVRNLNLIVFFKESCGSIWWRNKNHPFLDKVSRKCKFRFWFGFEAVWVGRLSSL